MKNYQYMNLLNQRVQNGPSAAVLSYDEEEGGVPKVVAHGQGQVAKQILELADANGIQMQEDPQLVQNLLDMDLGENIPPQLYSVIAEILLLIEEMENQY
ncbi:EscU/YscU/HrcU family type III secretion system export apparatus switch protein [Salsuginibacillus kocurii]|uniref:EscU/YscU/HrcU family type III secretion system export apparatus switch protein n=1 Tax=Salsuginibacillus kocurii TaxID=427078 RepID=UPI00037043B3|nr:EscU/YscU/HrcU family type III secretion system export apparatus switch protein [Salsuginibacillus kocurii]